jgi:hypothetical protein
MKKILLLLLVFFLLGCSSGREVRTGSYRSVRLNMVEFGFRFVFQNVGSCMIGSEILLNPDSTFKYTTCGNIMTGRWTATPDSLFLHVQTNRYRIDSLNKTGFHGKFPNVPNKPFGVKRNGCNLVAIGPPRKGGRSFFKWKYRKP